MLTGAVVHRNFFRDEFAAIVDALDRASVRNLYRRRHICDAHRLARAGISFNDRPRHVYAGLRIGPSAREDGLVKLPWLNAIDVVSHDMLRLLSAAQTGAHG